jgi:hypothetical protein
MKKYIYLLVLIPFLSAQCSDKGLDMDCGCDSSRFIKFLSEATATLQKAGFDPTSPDRKFYIYLDEVDSNAEYFSTLSSCDSLSFVDPIFQTGTRVRITGEIKPVCTNPLVRIGSSPIIISKIEVINGN